jgi:hypothetical protein
VRARDVPGGEAEGRHPHRLRVPLFTREVEGADKRGARGALVAVDSGRARTPQQVGDGLFRAGHASDRTDDLAMDPGFTASSAGEAGIHVLCSRPDEPNLARVPSDLVGTPVAGAVHRHIADRSVA